nr:MAG: hypothetical protein EDM05_24215 [Leptolyngbya sp. IPPAS B-1204]
MAVMSWVNEALLGWGESSGLVWLLHFQPKFLKALQPVHKVGFCQESSHILYGGILDSVRS